MEEKEGYVLYRDKGSDSWDGRMLRSLLTDEKVKVMRFQGQEFKEDFSHIPEFEIPKPPEGFKPKRLKKSELEAEVNYILCPDKKCGLFWDERINWACESYCPKKSLEKKIISCTLCKEMIVLPGDHNWMQNVSCKCGALHFTRMSGKYKLIYDIPK